VGDGLCISLTLKVDLGLIDGAGGIGEEDKFKVHLLCVEGGGEEGEGEAEDPEKGKAKGPGRSTLAARVALELLELGAEE
jgi:hypothetical protein